MRIDCHVHTRDFSRYHTESGFDRKAFLADLRAGGMDGAAVYSPSRFRYPDMPLAVRMQTALDICGGEETLFPIFWIDPTEEGAPDQVELAAERGFVGFKIIGYRHHPACPESMAVLRRIAAVGLPVIFHSGICWDGLPSSENLRPAAYEALITIPHLRFCLAHVGWPWYDECIAMFGKFEAAHRQNPDSPVMYIDSTPGTPKVYREEVFRHLLGSYDVSRRLMFGTDMNTAGYTPARALDWQETDHRIFETYVEKDREAFEANVFGDNFLRFIGKKEQ